MKRSYREHRKGFNKNILFNHVKSHYVISTGAKAS